jgi:hypothetical protein
VTDDVKDIASSPKKAKLEEKPVVAAAVVAAVEAETNGDA